MKRLFFELFGILGLTLVTGTVYTLGAGKLEFLVKADRYPNAQECNAPPIQTAPSNEAGRVDDGTSPKKLPSSETTDPPESDSEKIRQIKLAEAYELWEEQTLFIDARTSKRYAEGHIPGAISIAAWEPGIEEKIEQLAETEPREAPIVIYCNESRDCEDSHIVGTHLKNFDFNNLQIYEGGFPEWKNEKKPVHLDDEPGPRGPSDEEGGES